METPRNATDQANALLASGANADAVRTLTAAASKADPDATYTLALWHVYGHPVRRDFVAARTLFHRAGNAGHPQGARTFAVFTAIGAGGEPDWPAAVRYLENAAKSDPVAARQCELISDMVLKPDGMPQNVPRLESLSSAPKLALASQLLTLDECAHIITLAKPLMTPSVVVNPTSGKQEPHPIRTSDGTVLGPIQQDLVTHAINLRIAAVTGTDEEQGEPLAVMRYTPGQQYRLHHDCLPGEPNQRGITLIAYLNEGYENGNTHFPALGYSVQAKAGDAILFANLLPDGRVDERSRHAGLPVAHGEKWICTRWIRRTTFDPWGMRLTI
jgi:prolyl 4-hydroxylase